MGDNSRYSTPPPTLTLGELSVALTVNIYGAINFDLLSLQ